MSHISKISQLRRKRVALSAIFFIFWLGFADIDHQFDILLVHHHHHDCQQFASIHHGIHSPEILLPTVVSHGYIEPKTEPIKTSRPLSAYDARSPPITVLSVNYHCSTPQMTEVVATL